MAVPVGSFDGVEIIASQAENLPLINNGVRRASDRLGNAVSAVRQALPRYAEIIAEKSWRALGMLAGLQPLATTIAPVSECIDPIFGCELQRSSCESSGPLCFTKLYCHTCCSGCTFCETRRKC